MKEYAIHDKENNCVIGILDRKYFTKQIESDWAVSFNYIALLNHPAVINSKQHVSRFGVSIYAQDKHGLFMLTVMSSIIDDFHVDPKDGAWEWTHFDNTWPDFESANHVACMAEFENNWKSIYEEWVENQQKTGI